MNWKALGFAMLMAALLTLAFMDVPAPEPAAPPDSTALASDLMPETEDYVDRHGRVLRAFGRYERAVWHVVSQPWIFHSGDIDSAYYELQAAKQAAGWSQ